MAFVKDKQAPWIERGQVGITCDIPTLCTDLRTGPE